jgi:hypothetical protein
MSHPTNSPTYQFRWMHVGIGLSVAFGVVVALVLFAYLRMAHQVNEQRALIARVENTGGNVRFEHDPVFGNPPGPAWARALFGDDAFAVVQHVRLGKDWPDRDLAILHQWRDISYLNVEVEGVGREGILAIAKLSKLETLTLTPGKFTADDMRELSKLSELRSLTLLGGVDQAPLLPAFDSLSELESLALLNTNVVGSDLAHLRHQPSLRVLQISDARDLGDDGLAHIGNLRNLQALRLIRTGVTGADFSSLSELQKLRRLELSGSPIGDDGLAELAGLPTLSELELTRTSVTDAGCAAIARLRNLEHLTLEETAVTDEGLQQLRPLQRLSVLRIGPHVTPEAASDFHESLPTCSVRLRTETEPLYFSRGMSPP